MNRMYVVKGSSATIFSKWVIVVCMVLCGSMSAMSQCPSIDYYNRVVNPTNNPRYIANGWDTAVSCFHPTIVLYDTSVVTTQTYNGYYTVDSIPYAPADTTFCSTAGGGHQVPISVDDRFDETILNLPFPFVFFGRTYHKAVVGGNGVVTFDTLKQGVFCDWPTQSDGAMPSTSLAENYGNAIFAVVQDIDPGYNSSVANQGIYLSIYGEYPCRRMVVSWLGIPHFNAPDRSSQYTTAQIVCYEGTNIIEVHVKYRCPNTGWCQGVGYIGIQDSTGMTGTPPHSFAAPGRNPFSSDIITPEAWRFTPQGMAGKQITWYHGTDTAAATCRVVTNSDTTAVLYDSTGTVCGIEVSPTVPTTYTMRLQYTGANGLHYDLSSPVVVGVSEVPCAVLTATDSLPCNGTADTLTLTLHDSIDIVSSSWHCSHEEVVYTLSADSLTAYVEPFWLADGIDSAVTVTFDVDIVYSNGEEFTYTLSVAYQPTLNTYDTVVLCEGQSYEFYGLSADSTGYYFVPDSFSSRCLEQHHLQLQLLTNDTTFVCDTIVENALPHLFCDTTFFTDVTNKTFLFSDSRGCDSVVYYSLRVERNVYDTVAVDTLCANLLPDTVGGCFFAAPGFSLSAPQTQVHRDTLTAATGADSVLVVVLTLLPSHRHEDTVVSCDPYQWCDTMVDISGFYSRLYTNRYGCDSLLLLDLTLHASLFLQEHAEVCEGDLPYEWRDTLFAPGTVSGTFTFHRRSQHHCDSTVQLQLTVHVYPVISAQVEEFECESRRYILSARHTEAVDHVEWSHGGRIVGQDDTLHVSPASSTIYTASATIAGTQCGNSIDVRVEAVPEPSARIAAIPPFATPENSVITLQDRSASQGSNRQWYVDRQSGLDNGVEWWEPYGTAVDFQYSFPQGHDSVRFLLVVTEPHHHCHDTARVTIPYRGGVLWVPNAFTPTANSNTHFRAYGDDIVSFQMYIYTRNGIEVFRSSSIDEVWDGTAHPAPGASAQGRSVPAGQLCPEGAYVYLIRYTTKAAPRSVQETRGTVLLLQ